MSRAEGTAAIDVLSGETEQGIDALAAEADDQLTVDRYDGRGEDGGITPSPRT